MPAPRNRRLVNRLVYGAMAIFPLSFAAHMLWRGGFTSRWGTWVARGTDPVLFWAACTFLTLVGLFFAWLAIFPDHRFNRARDRR